MGITKIPIIIKGVLKEVEASVTQNATKTVLLGLNFLHAFRLALVFDGVKSFLTDALQQYDPECDCIVTPKQQAVHSNINLIIEQEFTPEEIFQSPPEIPLLKDASEVEFQPLSFDQQRELYFTAEWYAEKTHQFSLLKGPADFEPVDIITYDDAVLPKQKFYPLSEPKYRAAQDLVQDYLKKGILRHSRSSYSNPALIVPKPNGRWRLVVDLREWNKITKPDAYPLIYSLYNKVSKGKVFALIDLKDEFYQIPVTQKSSELVSVVFPFGLYEFTRLIMGWTNAPAEFQRKMNDMLQYGIDQNLIPRDTVEAYIDDLLAYDDDMPTLFQIVNKLLALLLKFNVAIIPAKCHFSVTTANYLGYVLVPGGSFVSSKTRKKRD